MPDNVGMRLVIFLLDEMFHLRPGKWMDRMTPWIILVLGGALVALMVYSCAAVNGGSE
jgi:hypothetical protein